LLVLTFIELIIDTNIKIKSFKLVVIAGFKNQIQ